MRFPIRLASRVLCAILPLLFVSCSKDENPTEPPASQNQRPRIEVGSAFPVAAVMLPPDGGRLDVSAPGASIDGLTIDVPEYAYEESKTYSVSTAPVLSHNLGSDFNVLTPLITIDNGGGYAEEPITITIPVKVPVGHFAMAWLYDHATGKLEGMPLISSDSTEVVVLVSNFEHSNIASYGKRSFGKGMIGSGQLKGGASSMLVSSIPAELLKDETNSDFHPATDGFQFVNWGSWAAPFGHCGGQTVAALWYYMTKRRNGAPQLYGRFDGDGTSKTPSIWEDDVLGYKFCSTLQTRLNWQVEQYGLPKTPERDLATLRAFMYAIRKTKNPQATYIMDGGQGGAHAIAVYRVSFGKAYVYDPNYPIDDLRYIEFDGKRFIPYNSGPDADHLGVPYPHIFYAGETALLNMPVIDQTWREVASGTVGEGLFPTFEITARNEDGDYVELVDGFKTEKEMRIGVDCDDFTPSYRVYDGTTAIAENQRAFNLTPGNHRLGIYVASPTGKWIGFKWFSVDVKEESKADTPYFGAMNMDLTVDGVPIDLNYRVFLMEIEAPKTYSLMVEGKTASGSALFVLIDAFTGPGTYPLRRENENASWEDLEEPGSPRYGWKYSVKSGQPGELVIQEWDRGTFRGYLEFVGWGSNISKVIKATFSHPKK